MSTEERSEWLGIYSKYGRVNKNFTKIFVHSINIFQDKRLFRDSYCTVHYSIHNKKKLAYTVFHVWIYGLFQPFELSEM